MSAARQRRIPGYPIAERQKWRRYSGLFILLSKISLRPDRRLILDNAFAAFLPWFNPCPIMSDLQ